MTIQYSTQHIETMLPILSHSSYLDEPQMFTHIRCVVSSLLHKDLYGTDYYLISDFYFNAFEKKNVHNLAASTLRQQTYLIFTHIHHFPSLKNHSLELLKINNTFKNIHCGGKNFCITTENWTQKYKQDF